MSEVIIKAVEVTKSFRNGPEVTTVLQGVNLEVNQGEFVSIVGSSGSGKSTLVGLLAGLDSPSSGKIYISGQEITGLSESKLTQIRGRMIGYVFQTFNLINTMTALENVEMPILLTGQKVSTKARAQELLELVGLSDRLGYRPWQLSGGQQQRVSLARALAVDPPIIIADEPTGNLDAQASRQVIDLLDKMVRELGKTLILVTHNMELAGRADSIYRIKDGSVYREEK
jgi:putative ABC transport system ATP-binding protein